MGCQCALSCSHLLTTCELELATQDCEALEAPVSGVVLTQHQPKQFKATFQHTSHFHFQSTCIPHPMNTAQASGNAHTWCWKCEHPMDGSTTHLPCAVLLFVWVVQNNALWLWSAGMQHPNPIGVQMGSSDHHPMVFLSSFKDFAYRKEPSLFMLIFTFGG